MCQIVVTRSACTCLIATLIEEELKRAEKYERLGREATSQPKQARFRHRARRYRHQAENLART